MPHRHWVGLLLGLCGLSSACEETRTVAPTDAWPEPVPVLFIDAATAPAPLDAAAPDRTAGDGDPRDADLAADGAQDDGAAGAEDGGPPDAVGRDG